MTAARRAVGTRRFERWWAEGSGPGLDGALAMASGLAMDGASSDRGTAGGRRNQILRPSPRHPQVRVSRTGSCRDMHTPTDSTRPPDRPATGQGTRPLPHESDLRWFVTDGGLETELVFHDGMDLPAFAAIPLLDTAAGPARLERYYTEYLGTAAATGAGFVAETPTWRANPDWGAELGYTAARLTMVNREAVAFLSDLRSRTDNAGMVVSGTIGPRSDGDPADLAERYADLTAVLPNLRVVGGCCGTNHRHVDAIARRVIPAT